MIFLTLHLTLMQGPIASGGVINFFSFSEFFESCCKEVTVFATLREKCRRMIIFALKHYVQRYFTRKMFKLRYKINYGEERRHVIVHVHTIGFPRNCTISLYRPL